MVSTIVNLDEKSFEYVRHWMARHKIGNKSIAIQDIINQWIEVDKNKFVRVK